MSLEQRVKKLEDELLGEAIVRVKYIFGGRLFRDCKRYQDKSCKRVEQETRQPLPEGTRIKFEFDHDGAREEEPCEKCTDYEK